MLTFIPSPSQGVWHLGPIPLRAYAFCILIGIFVAIYVGQKRLSARGGPADAISEIAIWAVPFGIVGGRLYHVFSSPDAYFGPNGNPVKAFYVWQGGLGIWGAVALGVVGVWIACRRMGLDFWKVLDSVAPGVLFAQAIGRLGNWFNQELFGRPTDLPWGLQIDPVHRPVGMSDIAAYHPTFLYELLWNVAIAVILIVVGNKLKWSHGQVFFAYIAGYTLGRLWIEALRIDPAELVFGLRLNIWTSLLLLIFGVVGFVLASRRRARSEEAAA